MHLHQDYLLALIEAQGPLEAQGASEERALSAVRGECLLSL